MIAAWNRFSNFFSYCARYFTIIASLKKKKKETRKSNKCIFLVLLSFPLSTTPLLRCSVSVFRKCVTCCNGVRSGIETVRHMCSFATSINLLAPAAKTNRTLFGTLLHKRQKLLFLSFPFLSKYKVFLRRKPVHCVSTPRQLIYSIQNHHRTFPTR